MAFTISRRLCLAGRPPPFGAGINGSKCFHSPSLKSLGYAFRSICPHLLDFSYLYFTPFPYTLLRLASRSRSVKPSTFIKEGGQNESRRPLSIGSNVLCNPPAIVTLLYLTGA